MRTVAGGRGPDFSRGYVRRLVDDRLDRLLPELPAVHLDGAKAVGKTATALQRARTVWSLQLPEPRRIVADQVDAVLSGQPPILVDEWQRVPEVWDVIRSSVDDDWSGGRFLLTGSTPSGTHSGAGRITSVMLRPLTLWERGVVEPVVGLGELLTGSRPTISGSCDLSLHDYAELVVASGFPALQQLSVEPREAQLDGYLQRITDVDMEEAGLKVQRPATVRAWLRAYAAASSTTARWERIRDAATPGTQDKPARSTTGPYRDVLTRLRILDEVEAWIPGSNQFSRLGSSAKHQLVDPALAARLLGVGREDLVTGSAGAVHLPRDGALFGALFESLATLDVRVYAGVARAVPAHFRTHDGRREVDLVVERPDGGVVAIEVKLGNTVADHDVSHLRWLHTQLGDRLLDSVVLTTGSIAHRRSDGIAVVPLGALGP